MASGADNCGRGEAPPEPAPEPASEPGPVPSSLPTPPFKNTGGEALERAAAASSVAEPMMVFRRTYEELESMLSEVDTPNDVARLLGRLHDGGSGDQFVQCITMAFGAFEMGTPVEQDFACMMGESGLENEDQLVGFKRELGDTRGLLSDISRWALGALKLTGPESFPKEITPWPLDHGPRKVTYTAAQCRGLLANVFLLNTLDTSAALKTNAGGLELARMLQSTRSEAAQKLACLLQYFKTSRALENTDDVAREIVIERRSWHVDELHSLGDFHQWVLKDGQGRLCDTAQCLLHDGSMEAITDADAFVNFANANFGYGRFIDSCTQEEIMQVCCPEFNVGMLHLGSMSDSEVVNVSAVRRFSNYTGYGGTFEFDGPWSGQSQVQTILTMDATRQRHFSEKSVLRDVRKAYLCFNGSKIISTGRWGCGVFGGMPAHKFSQQIVAASLAGCSLCFSTFGNLDQCDEVLSLIEAAKPDAAKLLKAVLEASSVVHLDRTKDFIESLSAALNVPAAPAESAS